jgi:hypothetical protein
MKSAGFLLSIALAFADSLTCSRAAAEASPQNKTNPADAPAGLNGNRMSAPGTSLDVGCWALKFQDAAGTTIAQDGSTPASPSPTPGDEQRVRSACIEGRRLICGRILDIVPEGLVVESGYTNLLRQPISKSWLIPGTVQASRAENLIEGKSPGAICVGRVLLSHTPRSKKLKPARYDYVIVQAYPAGQYTHTSAGAVQRTIRRFSANVMAAVQANLENESKPAK